MQDKNLEKIGKPWYYEEKNQLFVIKTVLHPHLKGSNYKIIYPEITIVNLDSLTTSKVFPGTDILTDSNTGKPFTTYTQLAEHNLSLLNTQHSINFVKVGSPQLSFNRGTKTYSLTYVAFDTTGMAYLFSYWLKRKENTFKLIRSTLLKPDKAIHSTNFTDFNTVSGQAVSQFDTTVNTGNQINDDGLTHLYLNDHPMGIPQNHGYNGWRPGEILTPANLNPEYTNKNAHAIIKSNNSLLCMGKKISKNEYRTLHNTVTYFRPRLTIQGGEKITITSNVAFYTYNGHAPARGACIFIYDNTK